MLQHCLVSTIMNYKREMLFNDTEYFHAKNKIQI